MRFFFVLLCVTSAALAGVLPSPQPGTAGFIAKRNYPPIFSRGQFFEGDEEFLPLNKDYGVLNYKETEQTNKLNFETSKQEVSLTIGDSGTDKTEEPPKPEPIVTDQNVKTPSLINTPIGGLLRPPQLQQQQSFYPGSSYQPQGPLYGPTYQPQGPPYGGNYQPQGPPYGLNYQPPYQNPLNTPTSPFNSYKPVPTRFQPTNSPNTQDQYEKIPTLQLQGSQQLQPSQQSQTPGQQFQSSQSFPYGTRPNTVIINGDNFVIRQKEKPINRITQSIREPCTDKAVIRPIPEAPTKFDLPESTKLVEDPTPTLDVLTPIAQAPEITPLLAIEAPKAPCIEEDVRPIPTAPLKFDLPSSNKIVADPIPRPEEIIYQEPCDEPLITPFTGVIPPAPSSFDLPTPQKLIENPLPIIKEIPPPCVEANEIGQQTDVVNQVIDDYKQVASAGFVRVHQEQGILLPQQPKTLVGVISWPRIIEPLPVIQPNVHVERLQVIGVQQEPVVQTASFGSLVTKEGC